MRLDRGRWLLALPALALPALLSAQGFQLNEVGSCAVARAAAVTAAPCHDASVIYWNPGAATMLPGWSVLVGDASIAVNGSFTQDFTQQEFKGNVPTQFPPHAFVNGTVTKCIGWGLATVIAGLNAYLVVTALT